MSRAVYGIHGVTEVLRGGGEVSALIVTEGAELGDLLTSARRRGLSPIERPRSELDRLAGGAVHQGVVALCGEYRYASIADLLDRAKGATPLILMLDSVTDPQNLGALLRSACLFGAHGVVIPQDRAAPVTAAVVKASSGASELVAVARVPNLVRAMQELKDAGLWLFGTIAGGGARPPWALDLRGPAAIVLGSEGRGLRPLVRKTCDEHIEVPMEGGLRGASLNVSAAGAVLLYEVLRQRRALSSPGSSS